MNWTNSLALFAQVGKAKDKADKADAFDKFDPQIIWIIVAAIAALIFLIFLFIFFSFIRLWIQGLLTGANIGIFNLVGMKLRKVNYEMIVNQKIALVQAGTRITTEDLESHFLAGGKVPRTAAAVIAAHKAGLDLPWKTAAAIAAHEMRRP